MLQLSFSHRRLSVRSGFLLNGEEEQKKKKKLNRIDGFAENRRRRCRVRQKFNSFPFVVDVVTSENRRCAPNMSPSLITLEPLVPLDMAPRERRR